MVSVNLYSENSKELEKFLSSFYNSSFNLKNNLNWEHKYENPVQIAEIIGTFIDNFENFKIMMWISLDKGVYINVTEENNIINVSAYVKVTCYDYVVNVKNNRVLRGTDKHKLELEYIIDFVKDNNSKTKINCPNCGNEVDIISSEKCQYCDSTLVQNASDFVMSKKTMIGQRTLRNITE